MDNMNIFKNILDFLVYSNIYLSLGASFVAYITIVILDFPFAFIPMFLAFSETFFVYNLNRQTDIKEDRINKPNRITFIEKYGRLVFYISIILYLLALIISFLRNFNTFIFVLLPIIISIFYSIFRLKRFLMIKNLLVGFAWGTLPLVVGSYFNRLDIAILIFYIFFSIEFFINTVIFDIKDTTGDNLNKIRTLPNVIGIKYTKYFMYVVNTFSISFLIFNIVFGILSPISISLIFFVFYVYLYIFFSGKKNNLFYGVFVDGEFVFLALFVFLFSLVI